MQLSKGYFLSFLRFARRLAIGGGQALLVEFRNWVEMGEFMA